jgi:hypothetical protein
MWVRKTESEIKAALQTQRTWILSPNLTRRLIYFCLGIFALLFFLSSPAAFVFLTILAFLAQICAEFGIIFRDPAPHLFCPHCQIAQKYAKSCSDCGANLEPMWFWKWAKETDPQSSEAPSAPARHSPVSDTSTVSEVEPRTITSPPERTIPLSLPTKRMILAAKIGVDEFRILKDLMDENLFAAINPRISDRDVLTSLGRKYRIAFRFVT